MAKYKVGDKVTIVKQPDDVDFPDFMAKYAGKTLTVAKTITTCGDSYYWFRDNAALATAEDFMPLSMCTFKERWIAGYASHAPLTVELCFDGAATTATLKRGGRAVKTVKAICNPKDTYSRGEGAKVAVERLFAKKKSEAEKAEAAKAHCHQVTETYKALYKLFCDLQTKMEEKNAGKC